MALIKTGLQELRNKKGQTIADVSKAIQCSTGNLSAIERGEVTLGPGMEGRLATYYEVKPREVLRRWARAREVFLMRQLDELKAFLRAR